MLIALHTFADFLAAGGARAFTRSDGSYALPCDRLILTAPEGYCLPVGFERSLGAFGAAPLDALGWMAQNAANAFADNWDGKSSEAAQDELRDLLAVRDWFEACGKALRASEIDGALPPDDMRADLLAWKPPELPPGYDVFATPRGRWAYERADGNGAGVGYTDRAAAVAAAWTHYAPKGEQG